MTKSENTNFSINTINTNTNINKKNKKNLSLLIPYYNTDKWTNKLKRKIKQLAVAYKDFYNKLEQENSPLCNQKYNKLFNKTEFYNKTAKDFMKHNRLYSDHNLFLKTSTNFHNKTRTNFMNKYENNNNNKILNKILPPVMNYNPDNENVIFDGINYYNIYDNGISFLSPKSYNLFCISAQQKNQHANMNKFYSNKKYKDKYTSYFAKLKQLNTARNIFRSRNLDDFNKFLEEFQSKNRINFFKKNDYNPQIKLTQPKDRKQIFALKNARKKQYLDYIKAKSEDYYMKYYYYQ